MRLNVKKRERRGWQKKTKLGRKKLEKKKRSNVTKEVEISGL